MEWISKNIIHPIIKRIPEYHRQLSLLNHLVSNSDRLAFQFLAPILYTMLICDSQVSEDKSTKVSQLSPDEKACIEALISSVEEKLEALIKETALLRWEDHSYTCQLWAKLNPDALKRDMPEEQYINDFLKPKFIEGAYNWNYSQGMSSDAMSEKLSLDPEE